MNGGTCSPTATGGFTCTCPASYTGTLCEQVLGVTPTVPGNPCLNGGTCVYIAGYGYRCVCPYGYTGVRCEVCNMNVCSYLIPLFCFIFSISAWAEEVDGGYLFVSFNLNKQGFKHIENQIMSSFSFRLLIPSMMQNSLPIDDNPCSNFANQSFSSLSHLVSHQLLAMNIDRMHMLSV